MSSIICSPIAACCIRTYVLGLQDRARTAKECADSLFRQGDFAGAVELYSRCLQLDPGKWQLHSNRCTARLKISDFVGAVEDADQALNSQPENTRMLARCEPMSFAQAAMIVVEAMQAYGDATDVRSQCLQAQERGSCWLHSLGLTCFSVALGHACLMQNFNPRLYRLLERIAQLFHQMRGSCICCWLPVHACMYVLSLQQIM